jgi:hypothetical protein
MSGWLAYVGLLALLPPLVGGGLAGALLTHILTQRRNRKIAVWAMWILPPINRLMPEENRVLCFTRFKVTSAKSLVRKIELSLPVDGEFLSHSLKRTGLQIKLDSPNRKVVLYGLREGDFVELLFLAKQENVERYRSSLLDYNSEDDISVRKDLSVWTDEQGGLSSMENTYSRVE